MDTQNPSAPTRAQSRTAGKNHPHAGGGLIHDNTRHTTRFTVIGNHLAQHPELSALAIGLAVYIQSLPKGAHVDIRTLAARFPEGRTRIAAALRELETHGYLRRERRRPHRHPHDLLQPARPPPRPEPPGPDPCPEEANPGPHPPPDGNRPPRRPPPPRPPPAALHLRHSPPGPRRRGLAGTRRHPHRRTPRPDHRPAARTPVPPSRPPGPPPHQPTATPTPVPRTRTTTSRPPSPPDLRRLRPRLPRTRTRQLP